MDYLFFFSNISFRQSYPDYYLFITQPIALSHIRKRSNGSFYEDVQTYREDWKLMFNNARTYNQEGSWVYNDANEMEKVFNATFDRVMTNSGLPGAPEDSTYRYQSPLTNKGPPAPVRSESGRARKQIISDDEYLTPSDDE